MALPSNLSEFSPEKLNSSEAFYLTRIEQLEKEKNEFKDEIVKLKEIEI